MYCYRRIRKYRSRLRLSTVEVSVEPGEYSINEKTTVDMKEARGTFPQIAPLLISLPGQVRSFGLPQQQYADYHSCTELQKSVQAAVPAPAPLHPLHPLSSGVSSAPLFYLSRAARPIHPRGVRMSVGRP